MNTMDVREKLVELLEPHMSGLACEYESGSCELTSCRSCNARNIADHLISNGVTVQEWVSVEDRLPEENTTVIVATDNGIVFQCLYSYDGWDLWDDNDVNITHWQPMPQPPKGE